MYAMACRNRVHKNNSLFGHGDAEHTCRVRFSARAINADVAKWQTRLAQTQLEQSIPVQVRSSVSSTHSIRLLATPSHHPSTFLGQCTNAKPISVVKTKNKKSQKRKIIYFISAIYIQSHIKKDYTVVHTNRQNIRNKIKTKKISAS